jgi:hypothetical protein
MKYSLRNFTIENFCFRFVIIFTLIITFYVVTGCNSFGERHYKIRNDFTDGKIEKAKSNIDIAIKKGSHKDADLLKLNSAIIELCSGRPKSSELLLREVRDNFDKLEQQKAKELALDAASFLTDDNTRIYSGEDYEKVLIRVFLAISNLMYDGSDAYAYAMQINDKQNKIIENRKKELLNFCNNNSSSDDLLKLIDNNYHNVAIGAYLSGLLFEETKRNYDDAYRNYEKADKWSSSKVGGYKFDGDLERVKHGIHSKSGNGVVYVFVLSGEGPYKVQKNCEALQTAQILVTYLLSQCSKAALIPDFAPIMIPVIIAESNRKNSIQTHISIDNDKELSGTAREITNISDMAKDQFEANKPMIIARAIARRTIKKGIVYGTKKAVDANTWIGLALEIGGMAWEAMETADTRCWNLLPNAIQVYRKELSAGEHEINLRVSNSSGTQNMQTNSAYSKKFRISDGRNTYILANFIGDKLIGKITVSSENNQ